MNFNIIESNYIEWSRIHDDFAYDFLHSRLLNNEIRVKYNMTHGEFRECCRIIKKENNIRRRPFWRDRAKDTKYYSKMGSGFIITKRIDGKQIYFGYVPSEEIAKDIVQIFIGLSWDVEKCRKVFKEYKTMGVENNERIHN